MCRWTGNRAEPKRQHRDDSERGSGLWQNSRRTADESLFWDF